MEQLGKTIQALVPDGLEATKASVSTSSDQWDFKHFLPSDNRLAGMQKIPSTNTVRERLEALEDRLVGDHDGRMHRNLLNLHAGAERQLDRAIERDTIQATRPAGCWCLGTGGARPYTVSNEPVILVYLETCNACPDGKEEQTRRDKELPAMAARIRQMEREGLWWRAHIPHRLSECRIETWPTLSTHTDHPLLKSLMVALVTEPHKSLFLWGPPGRGKTGLAIGYAWDCLNQLDIHSFRFTTAPSMFAQFRDTYNHPSHADTPTEGEIIALYSNVDLLILDDLGAEHVKNTGWVEDRLYQVIGTRHAERKATVFTSNLSLDALADSVGERITDRILEMVGDENVVSLSGLPNLREES